MSDNTARQRGFLNSAEWGGVAAYETKITAPEKSRHDADVNFEASLTLSDCTRNITLDFDCYGAESREHNRQKARKLRSIVNSFVREFLATCDEADGL